MNAHIPTETLYDRVAAIPGQDGWWSTGYDDFEDAAKKLELLGMGTDEIVAMLGSLYYAVAREYGE